jgi:histidinol-phosphate aminotransferase
VRGSRVARPPRGAGVLPRETGPGFTPYAWAATVADVASRRGLSTAHVLRFDANIPAFPAALPVPGDVALAERGEYPEGTYRELREAAAAYAGCRPDEVAVEAGADGLIALVAKVFLGPGRRAVVEAPTYPLYAIASRVEGAEVHAVRRDLDALREAASAAHVLWLCNPGNPTGEVWAGVAIGELAERLPTTLVCVDEAYFEYANETVAHLARELPNLVCIRTLSKAFGLAGLRVGYAIASEAVAAELSGRRAPAPIATASARLAALALRSSAVEAEVSATIAERERVRGAFASAGYDAPAVNANFVYVRTADAPAIADRLEGQGLVVRAYPDAVRITVRSPADDDLLLAALGLDAPRSPRRSATVLAPGARASLVTEGSGRVRVATGDRFRDQRLERIARGASLDLELVADATARDDDVAAVLGEALSVALAAQ